MSPIDEAHTRPDGASDEAVQAAGLMSEAFERIERARGALYEFHQLVGGADARLDAVVERLRACGRHETAERIARDLMGRNVLGGRWTFQVVEEFDADYYACWRECERAVRDRTVAGRAHVAEAEMKQRRITPGEPGHEPRPG